MQELSKAIKENDLLAISELYLKGKIPNTNYDTYKLIKKILYSESKNGQQKNIEKIKKEEIILKLIIEKSGYNLSYKPHNKLPILAYVLKSNYKNLSVYIAKKLTDKEIEPFAFQLNKKEDFSYQSSPVDFYSSIEIASKKSNIPFLEYILKERKLLENDPYIFIEEQTDIFEETSKMNLRVISIAKVIFNVKKLYKEMSGSNYITNLSKDSFYGLLTLNINERYDFSKCDYFKNKEKEILSHHLFETHFLNMIRKENLKKTKIQLPLYQEFINNERNIFSENTYIDNDNLSIVDNLLTYQAVELIKAYVDNGKINRDNLLENLRNYYNPFPKYYGILNPDKDPDNKIIGEKITKMFEFFVDSKLLSPNDILDDKIIKNKISQFSMLISSLEKKSIQDCIKPLEEEKNKSDIVKRRL